MFPVHLVFHPRPNRTPPKRFSFRFSALFCAVLVQSLLALGSFVSADFYQRTNFATQLELSLQRISALETMEKTQDESTYNPFSYRLVYNKKDIISADLEAIAGMQNAKSTHSQFYFALIEDEIGNLRKIERRLIDKGGDSIQTAIWLDRNQKVKAIEETLENQLVYHVRFNGNGQITSIKTRLLNNEETLFVENYRYGAPAMENSRVINRIAAANNDLDNIAPNIFNQNSAVKTIDYYYNGKFAERKIFWGERGQRAVLYFRPSHTAVELKSYEIIESVSPIEEVVYKYKPDHSRKEILTHRYENVDTLDSSLIGRVIETLSSKNYSIAYRYDASGAIEKKTIRDTLTGQAWREIVYQYLPIDSGFSLLFSPNFSSNTIQREIVFFQNEPQSFKKLYQGFFGVLVGVKEIQYLGKSRLKKQTKMEGNRIFSTTVVDGRLKNLEIKNMDGRPLASFEYSYHRDGRIHEETRYGALQEDFTKIRYIYDAEKPSLPNSVSTAFWGSGKSGRAILSNLAKHRVGMSFLGQSLFRYHLKTIANKDMLDTLTTLQTEKIGEVLLQRRKRIFEDTIVRAHMRNIETSGLVKVLFINSYDQVVGYVRIERSIVGEEKPDTADSNPFTANPVLPEQIAPPASTDINTDVTDANANTDANTDLNTDPKSLVFESLQNFSKNLSQIADGVDILPKKETPKPAIKPPPDPNAIKTLTFTYYGQEPLFFYNTERGFQEFADEPYIVRDSKTRNALRDGGRNDFRTRANDSIGLFAKEKKLESYTFFYRQDFLPFEATFSVYDATQGELISKQTVSRLTDEVTTQSPSFRRSVEEALINIPLFLDAPPTSDLFSVQ